jgi:hypothetical protein
MSAVLPGPVDALADPTRVSSIRDGAAERVLRARSLRDTERGAGHTHRTGAMPIKEALRP